MRRVLTRFVLVAAALAAIPAGANAATITVVHGIPGFKADVYLNGAKRLVGFQAGQMTPPVTLAAGRYSIAVRPAGAAASSRPVLARVLVLHATDAISIVAHLDRHGRPVITTYHDQRISLAPGRAAIIVRPAAALPPIDVLVDGARTFANLGQDANVSTSLPAGTHQISFVVAGTSRLVWGPTKVTVLAGKLYAIYPVGSLKQRTLDQLVSTFSARALPPNGVPAGTSGLAAVNGPELGRLAGGFDPRLVLLGGMAAAVLLCGAVFVRPRR